MIRTLKLKESIAFYTDVLQFTLDESNEEWGWASLRRDEVGIMIAPPNDHIPFELTAYTGSFYLNTEAVDYWRNQLKGKVNLAYRIENFEYNMREFAFYDINGYLIQYGSEITVSDDGSNPVVNTDKH